MPIDPTSKVEMWTPMIRTTDMKYPVYLRDFLREYPNISAGSFVWEIDMAPYNYYVAHEVPIPTGDVVTEGLPEYDEEEGMWYKTWDSRDFTTEEIATNLANAKDSLRITAYQLYSANILSGVVVEGETFVVEPREQVNIAGSRAYAVANPEQSILIRKGDYTSLTLPSSEAIAKLDQITVAAGKAHQKLLRYIDDLYQTAVITDLPPNPETFLEV